MKGHISKKTKIKLPNWHSYNGHSSERFCFLLTPFEFRMCARILNYTKFYVIFAFLFVCLLLCFMCVVIILFLCEDIRYHKFILSVMRFPLVSAHTIFVLSWEIDLFTSPLLQAHQTKHKKMIRKFGIQPFLGLTCWLN